jgi:uncharacterized protein (TIGR02186 family)
MLRLSSGWRWPGVVLFFGLVLGISGPTRAAALELRVSPNEVEIGSFFEGAQVELQGSIPAGSTAVVEVLGSTATEKLLRKGRRGGLWMSVGEIQVHKAPSLYLVLSSSPKIPELPGKETSWGIAALQRKVKFSGRIEAGEQAKFFQEFLELKKHERVYGILPGGLKVSAAREGQSAIHGIIPLPAKVPVGKYQVRLSVIQDGHLLPPKERVLEVRMVGFPAMLFDMAQQQGALYGVLAVLIAIATGFLMGFLFKGKTEH